MDEPTASKPGLLAYLIKYRQGVEAVWREETASPNLRPTKSKPISTGQCSATSLVLFDDLHKAFGSLNLKIALGKVWSIKANKCAIPLHVWLQLYTDDAYASPLIIDLAADQADVIEEKVICETAIQLVAKQGYAYVVDNLFPRPADFKTQTQERARLLRHLLAQRNEAVTKVMGE